MATLDQIFLVPGFGVEDEGGGGPPAETYRLIDDSANTLIDDSSNSLIHDGAP